MELYQQILERHHAELAPEEIADIHCLVAQGYGNLNQPEPAANHYRQALKAKPEHLPALRASIELARQTGQYQEAVVLLKHLRELSPTPPAQVKLSIQIGDVYLDQLSQPEQAAQAYQEGLAGARDNIELLEKLRRAFTRAEHYDKALEVLDQLVRLTPADRRRARFYQIAGDISAERLNNETRALDYYLQALDVSPLDKRAHAAAVKLLNHRRDWRRLAAISEKLLQRLPPPIAGQEDWRSAILNELVQLYRYQLNDTKGAISASEHLLSIASGDLKVREDLARLYEAEGRFEDASALHQSLIADSPFSVDSYHALRRIYERQGAQDKALCLSATLDFLDEANDEEQALLAQQGKSLPIPGTSEVSEALYSHLLLHSHAGGLLGEMFSFVAENCRSALTVDARSTG